MIAEPKFQSSRPHSSWEKCDEKLQCLKFGEKEKRNKGTNKQQQPDSGIHDTSAHFPSVPVSSFNLLGLLVPEKKWDEKF